MPQYTFRIEAPTAEASETLVEEFENDEVAVHVARRRLGARRASLRVGRGVGDNVEWIGVWDAAARHAAWLEPG